MYLVQLELCRRCLSPSALTLQAVVYLPLNHTSVLLTALLSQSILSAFVVGGAYLERTMSLAKIRRAASLQIEGIVVLVSFQTGRHTRAVLYVHCIDNERTVLYCNVPSAVRI